MRSWVSLLSFCVFSVSLFAQSTNATISGGVADPAGRMIANADIEIQNDATGVIYSSQTNSAGIYVVPILPPGHYHVQVAKPGFKTIIQADVVLNVQSAVALNFTLPIGALSESVTVDSSTPALNTTDATVSTVVDHNFVENAPLNGRSFQDLISMTPGVVTQSPQSSNQLVGVQGDFSVNGQRTQSNYYTVDGVTANISAGNAGGTASIATGGALAGSTTLGTTQAMVSVDALQEFRVQSSTYSAEYGRSPGGQFSLATRSGTNMFHGSAYDYLRNGDLDANDWFNDHYGDAQPALHQNDFGGTLGGPVWLPRLYDGKNHTFFFVSYEGLRLTQPTAAAIQYVPDLFMRQQAISTMRPILDAFPLPNGIDYGTTSNPSLAQFIATYSLPSSINATSVRLDQTIGQKLSIFFRAAYTPSSSQNRSDFARTVTQSNALTGTFGANAQLEPTVANEFRIGYSNVRASQIGTLDNFGGATPTDLAADMGAGSFSPVEPAVYFYFSGIGGSLMMPYYGKNASRQWNLVDTVSISHGNHNLKFGVDYRHIVAPVTPPSVEPYAIFESSSSSLSGAPTIPYVFNYLASTPRLNQLALFAQDEWHVHPRLNISFGIRWEADPPPTGAHGGDAFTLQGSFSDPSSLTVAPRGTPLWRTPWYNFAPRLGFAWTAHSTPGLETILRAGGGVFFDSPDEVATLGFSELGFRSYDVVAGATLPFTKAQLTVPITTTAPYTNAIIIAFPTHLQLPYTLEWNAALQQALGKNQTFTLSYVASNGRRLLQEQELYLGNLNPNFGYITYFAGGVTSNYQSLQVSFQRTVTKGIQALGSYTWSHSLDYGSNATALPLQRGNSDYDVRNNAQAGLTWDLPTTSGRNIAAYLSNGWGLDGRLNLRSAFPIMLGGDTEIDAATGSEYAGGLNIRPNRPFYLYGSQYPGGKAINPEAFYLPVSGEGGAPRNFIRGFGATQINLAIRRDFPIHDLFTLQFRAENFNLLNHPNFGYVDPDYGDATFGQATETLAASLGTVASQYQQGGPRSMQFALRLKF
ncbi:TonB-dependent receptor domain-containing protein [Silvibacterium sp.]|uniref:TonB-dependent receptor n=1 Tax=Silvibacterium sp. TaxID=1964179 RepID=UPI0039E514D0